MATKTRNTISKKRTQRSKSGLNQVATATARQLRISPQKLRLVMELIRGKQVEPAIQILKFSPKKGAGLALKLLNSAIANARERRDADVDRLWVMGGFVGAGKTMKRFMPRAHGRADMLAKRTSHMTVILGEK
jgi:large subunit ribosomal protein L22